MSAPTIRSVLEEAYSRGLIFHIDDGGRVSIHSLRGEEIPASLTRWASFNIGAIKTELGRCYRGLA
jgi:hypothetical protein